MESKMQLTDAQRAILNGAEGEVKAKVMETLVRFGEIFGAKKWCLSHTAKGIWSPASA